MKRDAGSIARLAMHEMGHVALGYTQAPTTVMSSMWSTQGFTFTEISSESDWSNYDRKVGTIAAQVAVALGGGAAEVVVLDCMTADEIAHLDFAGVLAAVGTIDIQHAQEWLALQRHDPSQDSIEVEVIDVFKAVATDLAAAQNVEALQSLAALFLKERGDLTGDRLVGFEGSALEAQCRNLQMPKRYCLKHTIAPNVIAETTTR